MQVNSYVPVYRSVKPRSAYKGDLCFFSIIKGDWTGAIVWLLSPPFPELDVKCKIKKNFEKLGNYICTYSVLEASVHRTFVSQPFCHVVLPTLHTA